MSRIHRVSPEFLCAVIENRSPCGLFLTRDGRWWVAVDNRDGDAWTEDSRRKRQAVRWLRDDYGSWEGNV